MKGNKEERKLAGFQDTGEKKVKGTMSTIFRGRMSQREPFIKGRKLRLWKNRVYLLGGF